MSRRFPNLEQNRSDFPDANNVNVFKYDNKLDYSRFDATQMHVTLCMVPWDMGEVHIGNRTMSGVGNVVDFGSAAKRDEWLAAIPNDKCYRFDTDIRRLHRDEYMDVDLPFDIAAHYNYIAIYYELVPDADYPLAHEKDGGIRSWFWFIRDVEQLAPNTTRLHIMLDAWQTFIYDFDVTSMILERGHAPLSAMPADTYLSNPMANCSGLLAEDENYGDLPNMTANTDSFVFNAGDMYAVIIMTANGINGVWGSKAGDNWKTPATRHFQQQGVPSYCAFAVAVSNLNTLLNAIDSTYPQAAQCISAIAFVSSDVLTLGVSHEDFGVTIYEVSAGYKRQPVTQISKSQFGYPTRYRDLAKLYTYPYAVLEVTDQDGNMSEIRIEETDGEIELDYCLSLAYPWLNISGQICNTGKAGRKNISFRNVTARTMPIGGNWHKLLMQWNVPTFGIVQDAGIHNDYDTHYDRAQTAHAGLNAYNNEIASAATAQADVNANAANVVANAALQVALNNANNSANQTKIRASESNANAQAAGNTATASVLTTNSTNNEIDLKYATGTTAAVSSAVNGAISGGMALAATGPGAAAGAIAGGAIGAISSAVTMQAGINYTSAQLDAAHNQMSNSLAVAQAATTGEANATSTCENSKTTAANSYTTGTNANNAATMNANAARDYSTAAANASRNLDTVNTSISNQIKQAALDAPMEYGNFANGDTSTTRPMGIFANVVTQNPHAIERAGDEFLRYGYRYDKQWRFDGKWALMPKFTYWKLRDFWVSSLKIPDMYADKLRFFLFGGVTVWSKPEYIGNTSIYDNK